MTLVVDKPPGTPAAVHALVIGVSTYPWLIGGSNAQSAAVTDSMGQLDSPAISARRFADWLVTDLRHLGCGLATIEMLLSDDSDQTYAPPLSGGGGREPPRDVEYATIDAIIAAAARWKARGDQNEDNLLIFFFCGHGMASGYKYALLTRDYASIPERPLRGSFGIDGLLAGMKSCRAMRQVYFVDACRVATDRIIRNYNEGLDPLIAATLPVQPGVQQSVYYSTLLGEAAFGRNGATSLFTQTLMDSLQGLAANEDDGDWRINTAGLQRALQHLSTELADPEYGEVQTPTSGTQSVFDLHFLAAAPIVPFYLTPTWHEGDAPPDDILSLKVSFNGARAFEWQRPWAASDHCAWHPSRFRSMLRAGHMYTYRLSMEGGESITSAPWYLSPPYKSLKVSRDGDDQA